MMIMFPLTFLSNAFVTVDTLPDWLQAFVKVNPVSHLVIGRARPGERRRRHRARSATPCWAALVVIAIFAPLSVRSYKSICKTKSVLSLCERSLVEASSGPRGRCGARRRPGDRASASTSGPTAGRGIRPPPARAARGPGVGRVIPAQAIVGGERGCRRIGRPSTSSRTASSAGEGVAQEPPAPRAKRSSPQTGKSSQGTRGRGRRGPPSRADRRGRSAPRRRRRA